MNPSENPLPNLNQQNSNSSVPGNSLSPTGSPEPTPVNNNISPAASSSPQEIYSHNTYEVAGLIKEPKRSRFMIYSLVAGFVLLLGGGGFLLFNLAGDSGRPSSSKVITTPIPSPAPSTSVTPAPPPIPEAVIKYSELKQVSAPDSSFSLSIPTQFTGSQQEEGASAYYHRKPNKTAEDNYATAGIAVEDLGANANALRQQIVAQYKDPSSSALSNLKSAYMQQGITTIVFGSVTGYKNGVTIPITSMGDNLGNIGEGRVVIIFGRTHAYTLTLLADKDVWDNNTDVFNKVVDSLSVK